jgi:hypothetical protein
LELFFIILARRMPVIASMVAQIAQAAMTGFIKRIP